MLEIIQEHFNELLLELNKIDYELNQYDQLNVSKIFTNFNKIVSKIALPIAKIFNENQGYNYKSCVLCHQNILYGHSKDDCYHIKITFDKKATINFANVKYSNEVLTNFDHLVIIDETIMGNPKILHKLKFNENECVISNDLKTIIINNK